MELLTCDGELAVGMLVIYVTCSWKARKAEINRWITGKLSDLAGVLESYGNWHRKS